MRALHPLAPLCRPGIAAVTAFLWAPAAAQAAGAAETPVINSIGFELVLIPAGSFVMGSGSDIQDAGASEQPAHKVSISKPFYLGKYEVTQTQWEAVMGSSPFTLDRSNSFYNPPGMAARLRKPTNPATVSWNDAQEFIKRLNDKEGHRRYRLPTEAEWKYSARAGSISAYSFGNDERKLGDYAWFGENLASGSTHPVGSNKPNPWGLHDVHGNVWE